MALVSFITVTFNHERYIGKCIESVQAQTFKDWEMVIVDDDSTDKTCEVVHSFEKDKQIRFFEQPHRGVWILSETYNKGLSHCRGKYIAVLEGDDFAYPHRLEKSLETIGDAVGVCGKADVIDVEGNKIRVVPPSPIQCSPHIMLTGCHFPSGSFMVRADILRSIGGFQRPSSGVSCDYVTWLALLGKGKIAFVDEVLYAWVQHSDNATGCNATGKYAQYTRLDLDAVQAFRSWPKQVQDKSGWTLASLKWFWRQTRFLQKARSLLR